MACLIFDRLEPTLDKIFDYPPKKISETNALAYFAGSSVTKENKLTPNVRTASSSSFSMEDPLKFEIPSYSSTSYYHPRPQCYKTFCIRNL